MLTQVNSQPKNQTPQQLAQSYASLIRPQMSTLPLVIYASQLFINELLNVYSLVLGWIVLLASYAVVVTLNDLSDEKIDKFNNRTDLPLVNGSLTKANVRTALYVSTVVGLISSYLLNPFIMIWFSVYIILGWLYSGYFTLKNTGYLSLCVLAICYGVMPWVLGILASESIMNITTILAAVTSFVFVFGIISLKDFKDAVGDKKFGKDTILVKKGTKFTHNLILYVSSSAYMILICVSAIQGNLFLLFIGSLLLFFHFTKIKSHKIIVDSLYRKKYGNLSRLLFFIFAIISSGLLKL